VDNGALWDVLRKRELSLTILLQILLDTASGMIHLHSEKIIHRDLAARNILCYLGK